MPQVNEFSWFKLNLSLVSFFGVILILNLYLFNKSIHHLFSSIFIYKYKYFL